MYYFGWLSFKDQLKMIENEYSRQEDSYKQQIADLEEEKEQLQVSESKCFQLLVKLFRCHLVSW